jgi:hypothetical protein
MTVKGGDLDQLLNTKLSQPYIQILYNVTQTPAGATGLTFIIFILTM